jgi:hypothetical protein
MCITAMQHIEKSPQKYFAHGLECQCFDGGSRDAGGSDHKSGQSPSRKDSFTFLHFYTRENIPIFFRSTAWQSSAFASLGSACSCYADAFPMHSILTQKLDTAHNCYCQRAQPFYHGCRVEPYSAWLGMLTVTHFYMFIYMLHFPIAVASRQRRMRVATHTACQLLRETHRDRCSALNPVCTCMHAYVF